MVQCQSPGGQSCCWKAVTYPCWDAGLKMDSAHECSFTPIMLFLEESIPQCLIRHKTSHSILFTSKLYLTLSCMWSIIHILYAGGIMTRTEVGIWCPSPVTFFPLNNKRKTWEKTNVESDPKKQWKWAALPLVLAHHTHHLLGRKPWLFFFISGTGNVATYPLPSLSSFSKRYKLCLAGDGATSHKSKY